MGNYLIRLFTPRHYHANASIHVDVDVSEYKFYALTFHTAPKRNMKSPANWTKCLYLHRLAAHNTLKLQHGRTVLSETRWIV